MLHGNFWSNVEMDLDSGQLVERDSALPTPEQLYQMTDADFMFEALHDDLMLQMSLYCRGEIEEVDTRRLDQLADALDRSPVGESTPESVAQLRTAYAFAATRYILDQAAAFATARNKNLLVVLFCPTATRQLIDSGDRYDQPIVDYLEQRGQRYFDMNLVHVEDYNALGLSLENYMKRYFIGHYSPAGNHFFAFSIKDEIVDWLDPKPVTYRQDEQALIDFREGYLE